MHLSKITSVLSIFSLLLLFTACDVSNSDSAKKKEVAVKMALQASSATPGQAKASATSAIELTEVKMLVEELELESSVDSDSLDFEVDDLIVNLPLDGSEFELTRSEVPEGLYDEFEMEIEQPDNSSSIDDTDFYDETGNGYSIVIKGTYSGEDFTYRTDEDFELEMELDPPLDITADSSPSVAIQVDPSGWFKDENGNDLDPNDSASAKQIEENIKKSFNVEKDDEDDDDDNDDDGDDNGDD